MCKSIVAFYNVIKQLVYILSKAQRKKAIIVFVSMILTSCLELIGVSAIYPFLQAIISPESIKDKGYVRFINYLFPKITNNEMMLFMGVIIILVFLLKNVIALWFIYIQNKFASDFQRDESTEMLESYLTRPYQYFINTNSSVILRGINEDVSSVYSILLNMFQLAGEILTVGLLGVFLLKTDWFIALTSLILVAGSSFAIIIGLKGKMKKAGQIRRKAIKERNQYSYQAINGIKEITVLNRRQLFVNQFRRAADNASKAMLTNAFYSAMPDRILEGACIGGIIGIICIRILFGIELDTFIPSMGTFAMGAFKIIPSASKISTRINNVIYNMPGLQSCYENIYIARNADIDEEYNYPITKLNGDDKRIRFNNVLDVNDVWWKYQTSDVDILKGLSIKIQRGEAVAFIGASGAGKTTLADVIMGLLKPKRGDVKVDGIDIFSIPEQWSKVIGYVPQTVFLVDDTIRANIAFGLPTKEVSDQRIWMALEQAQLRHFVETLPDGLDTIVGERGIKFSGGQRQRVAIARALYEDPDILILDEATSALDTETETAVMESIEALQGQKTLIIVAHRLTTIQSCDKIYEIVDGKAIERMKKEIFN